MKLSKKTLSVKDKAKVRSNKGRSRCYERRRVKDKEIKFEEIEASHSIVERGEKGRGPNKILFLFIMK